MRELLNEIATSTAQAIGVPFLTSLVKSIREAMDAELVFITTGLGQPPVRARSLVSWGHQQDSERFEYDLEGTPCRLVYAGETLVVSEGLYRQFPREAGYEGYIGVPLHGGTGKVSGHLAVLSRKTITGPEEAAAIIKLFAMRAEAELLRLEHERERDILIASLAQANRRLQSRHSALRQSNETKAMLLGMLAHDLRNPLAVITTRGELVQALVERNSGDAIIKAQESCETIMSMAERMDRLIGAILKQAREDSQLVLADFAVFPVARAAGIAAELNTAAAEAKRIAVDLSVPPDLAMRGDKDRIVEALDNIISNAIKYSHPGQTVRVSARTSDQAVLLSVSDEGQGLTPEDQTRAFRQFQRLSARPTAGETSTGLGLSIVKTIAEAHGGSVEVASGGKNLGATFTLVFPAA